MNILLLFLAFPIATILLAIVLEKVLESPTLVGMTFFAVYLVITYAFFDTNFLLFAIGYTILAVITACLTRFIQNCLARLCATPMPEPEENDDEIGCCCQARNPRVITGRIQVGNQMTNGRNCRGR